MQSERGARENATSAKDPQSAAADLDARSGVREGRARDAARRAASCVGDVPAIESSAARGREGAGDLLSTASEVGAVVPRCFEGEKGGFDG